MRFTSTTKDSGALRSLFCCWAAQGSAALAQDGGAAQPVPPSSAIEEIKETRHA